MDKNVKTMPEYSPGDVAALNAIIGNNGLKSEKAPEDVSIYDYVIEDELTFEQRCLCSNMKHSFTIKIFPIGNVLDETSNQNFSIKELLKVCNNFLSYIKKV